MQELLTITEPFIQQLIKNSQVHKGKLLVQSRYVKDIIIAKDYTHVQVTSKCKASMKKIVYEQYIKFSDEDIIQSKCTCAAGYDRWFELYSQFLISKPGEAHLVLVHIFQLCCMN